MKAAQINEYGGKDVLKVTDDAVEPKATAGHILVEVHAAGVNPFDWKVRAGYMQAMGKLDFPATLGSDLAGIVAEVGEGVPGFSVGDEVYGQANALGGQGSYAEFAPVKAESLGSKPKSVSFNEAAALPLAGVSAFQALAEHIGLKRGQKILIHGGAGGIGSFAIPIAKQMGAYVATTAIAADASYVKELGADETIDYTAQDFSELLRDYDAVYDTVGGDTYKKSFRILKKGGTIVSMVEQADEQLMGEYNVHAISQFTRVTTERLAKLAELVDKGAIKPQIDKVFPLDQAADALAYIEEGKHHGKVVLTVKE